MIPNILRRRKKNASRRVVASEDLEEDSKTILLDNGFGSGGLRWKFDDIDDGDKINGFLKPLWNRIAIDDYLPTRNGDAVSQAAVIVHIGQLFAVLVTASLDFAVLFERDEPQRFHQYVNNVGDLRMLQLREVDGFDVSWHTCKYICVDIDLLREEPLTLAVNKYAEVLTAHM
ncbi:hypothetical protein AAVH_14067 [Aphelenchoides avenae]|nr:hypothetical protein AAVH_14067 [Aphelenchus avenae]